MESTPFTLRHYVPFHRRIFGHIVDRQHPTSSLQDVLAKLRRNARALLKFLARDTLLTEHQQGVNHDASFLCWGKLRAHDWMIAPYFDAEQSSYAACCTADLDLQMCRNCRTIILEIGGERSTATDGALVGARASQRHNRSHNIQLAQSERRAPSGDAATLTGAGNVSPFKDFRRAAWAARRESFFVFQERNQHEATFSRRGYFDRENR